MDLDQAAARLYAEEPASFTAARTALERQARAAGDRELARRIHALRKPTVAAWVSNLLVRERPEAVQPLVALGGALREAQESLQGPALRELSRRRRQLISALVLQARELALAAGQRVSEDVARQVEQTLDAALADPDAATELLSGRLSAPLLHTGFGPPAAATDQPMAAATQPPEQRPAGRDEVGAARRRRDEQAAARARREVLAAARRAATAAAKEAGAAQQRAQAAADALQGAEERREQLQQRIAALQDELSAATGQLDAAKRDIDAAAREQRRTARVEQASREDAEQAKRRLAELTATPD